MSAEGKSIDPRLAVIVNTFQEIAKEPTASTTYPEFARRILSDLDLWVMREANKQRADVFFEPRLLGMKLCPERRHFEYLEEEMSND